MKALGLILTFLGCSLAFSSRTEAQCPVVSLSGPSQIAVGTLVRITAQVPSIHSSKLLFKWVISGGTITSGDNTSSITIDTAGLGGQTITVSVEVIGATPTCGNTTQKTIDVEPQPPAIENFDIYGDIKWEDEKARLDNFAIAVTQIDKSYFAHIYGYAGVRTYPNEASERLARAKNYLVKIRGMEPNRIITIDRGHSDEFQIWLYLLPGGTRPLLPQPSQISPNKLDFSKPHARQSKKSTQG